MPKICLHIGLEKTGTTAIQHFLASNRQALQSKGFYFPTSPGPYSHVRLAAYCHDHDRKKHLAQMLGINDAQAITSFRTTFAADFDKEISKRRGKIILSSEHCSSRLNSRSEIQALRDFLATYDDNPKIIVYLRRQDELLESTYSTSVKAGRTEPFKIPTAAAAKHRYDYWHLLQLWSASFGKQNIAVRLFEDAVTKHGSIIEDFAEAVGMTFSLAGFTRPSIQNRRLGCDTVEFLRLLNQALPNFSELGPNRSRAEVVRILEDLPAGDSRLLTAAERLAFFARYKESNARVAAEYLGRENSTLFATPTEEKGETQYSGPALTVERAVELTAAIWSNKRK